MTRVRAPDYLGTKHTVKVIYFGPTNGDVKHHLSAPRLPHPNRIMMTSLNWEWVKYLQIS